MKIKKITNPYAFELQQARLDQSVINGKPMVERPYWYENTETGQQYYDLCGCIQWPTKITDSKKERPGYVAVVGVVKSKNEDSPENALFQLMAEGESEDVPTLLNMMISVRSEYGFGLHPNLFEIWFGDPDNFVTTLALKNEKLTAKGGEKQAILITPPNDFYDPNAFEIYFRSLRSCLVKDNHRFFWGKNEILRNRLRGFLRDDPAVMAIGGLIHTLLCRCIWMDQTEGNVFVVEENF